jgi:hypothetical protein
MWGRGLWDREGEYRKNMGVGIYEDDGGELGEGEYEGGEYGDR